jgi:hypothetical protein
MMILFVSVTRYTGILVTIICGSFGLLMDASKVIGVSSHSMGTDLELSTLGSDLRIVKRSPTRNSPTVDH